MIKRSSTVRFCAQDMISQTRLDSCPRYDESSCQGMTRKDMFLKSTIDGRSVGPTVDRHFFEKIMSLMPFDLNNVLETCKAGVSCEFHHVQAELQP